MQNLRESKRAGFDGVIGQDVPMRTIAHLVQTEHLPGTLLFSGPGGVGKLAAALALAKYLNCETREGGCCECRSCKAIREGNHPGVLVVSRERQILVEEMRELVAVTGLRASRREKRIVIIDRAENVTQASYNASLKALEEPGEHVHFILIADTPAALLPTVRSRAYQLRFSLLSPEEMRRFAAAIGDDPEDAKTSDALLFAQGQPGRYLRARHSEKYSVAAGQAIQWFTEVLACRRNPSVEACLEWKQAFRANAENLASAEADCPIPRGGDAFEIRRWLAEPNHFTLSPINWRTAEHGSKTGRWTESRKILLLASLLRHALSADSSAGNIEAVFWLQDLVQKVKWNCSFDIALERLYFKLAGIQT